MTWMIWGAPILDTSLCLFMPFHEIYEILYWEKKNLGMIYHTPPPMVFYGDAAMPNSPCILK